MRSGAAGETIANLGNQGKGVATRCHYDAMARCLGHREMTSVTVDAYIGPLASLLVDTGAVLCMEGEGAAGGVADVEEKISMIPIYSKIVVGEGERELTKAEKAPRKLLPGVAMEVGKCSEVIDTEKAKTMEACKLWCVETCVALEDNLAKTEGREPAYTMECGFTEATVGGIEDGGWSDAHASWRSVSNVHKEARKKAV